MLNYPCYEKYNIIMSPLKTNANNYQPKCAITEIAVSLAPFLRVNYLLKNEN